MSSPPSPARRSIGVFASLPLIAALAGCGGREATYPVSGVVQFDDGNPVPYGVVEFRAKGAGRIARGQLDPSGRFTLGTFATGDGAIVGTHQVIVVQHILPDQRLAPAAHDAPPHGDEDADGHAEEHAARSEAHEDQPRLVAPKHASYATSGLTADVRSEGANEVTLVVEGYSPRRGAGEPRP
jgi:hypothetical protein